MGLLERGDDVVHETINNLGINQRDEAGKGDQRSLQFAGFDYTVFFRKDARPLAGSGVSLSKYDSMRTDLLLRSSSKRVIPHFPDLLDGRTDTALVVPARANYQPLLPIIRSQVTVFDGPPGSGEPCNAIAPRTLSGLSRHKAQRRQPWQPWHKNLDHLSL